MNEEDEFVTISTGWEYERELQECILNTVRTDSLHGKVEI